MPKHPPSVGKSPAMSEAKPNKNAFSSPPFIHEGKWPVRVLRGAVVSVLVMFLLLFTLYSGLLGVWRNEEGRTLLHRQALSDRNKLVSVPVAERGLSWKVHSLYSAVVYDLPAFIVGFNAERAVMYSATSESTSGAPTGFKGSMMVFDHEAVSATLNDPLQIRGMYLGNAKVPLECMGEDTLIFMSTGATHTAMRAILFEVLPALKDPLGAAMALPLDYGKDGEPERETLATMPAEQVDQLVRRTLVRTLFRALFHAPISDAGLEALMRYPKFGGTCVLGEDFKTLTGGFIHRELVLIRAAIRDAILDTPVGAALQARAAQAVKDGVLPGDTEEQRTGVALVRQLADGVAFAGNLGTSHLVVNALKRIRSDPQHYVPLFHDNPVAFLHEEARVDPPVTSVTSVLGRATTVGLGPSYERVNASFPSGTPYQNVISTANVDPKVFGGPHHSRDVAYHFIPGREHTDEILSWNGRLGDVKNFEAPRGCPGYRLSMELSKSLVSKFAAEVNQVPQPLDHGSAGAAATLPNIAAISSKFASAEHSHSSVSFVDHVAFMIWFICAVSGIGFIVGKGSGACSDRYTHYLAAQALVAVGFLYELNTLFVLGQIAAGTAYMIIFVTVTCQNSLRTGWAYSCLIWALFWFMVISTFYFRFVGGQQGLAAMQTATYLYYTFGASMGVASVVKFFFDASKKAKANPDDRDAQGFRNTAVYGLIGAFFGVVDLALVSVPVFGNLLSRIADSTLYVPFMIVAVMGMDKFYPSDDMVLPNRAVKRFVFKSSAIATIIIAVAVGHAWTYVSSGDICALQHNVLLPSDPYFYLCQNSAFAKASSHSRIMHFVASLSTETACDQLHRPHNEDPKSILLPKYEAVMKKKEVFEHTGYTIPTNDEDVEGQNWFAEQLKDFFMNTVLKSPVLFPITDDPKLWSNLDEARATLKLAGGKHLPHPVSDWGGVDVTSDGAIAQMCFAGLAGSRVVRVKGTDKDGAQFMVDFSKMVTLDTRPGYEPYGATAYFDKDLTLLRIFWSHAGLDVYPGDKNWAHAKWVFRCSALVGITAVEHLLENHLIYANIASTASRESAPKDHPIRRFLKPFNHMTPTINLGAYMTLTTKYSLLHHTVSLTWNGLMEAFKGALRVVRYSAEPMEIHSESLKYLATTGSDDHFPYARDGLDYYALVLNFARAYMRIYYENDEALHEDAALERVWSKMRVLDLHGESSGLPKFSELTRSTLEELVAGYIFHVTGLHHVVGNVAEYLQDPTFASARIRPRIEISDVESSLYGITIAVLTGTIAPRLMNNFEHLLLEDEHLDETKAVLRGFQANLTTFAEEIDRRNDLRRKEGRWVYHGFDPRLLLSSVSI